MSRPQHTQGKGNILKYNEESTKQITLYGQVESPEYLDSIIGEQLSIDVSQNLQYGRQDSYAIRR